MRAYLFVLIYAGMLPLALLSPFAGAMIWAWLSLMYPQSQTYGYFSFGFAAPVAALTLAAFLLSRERALPPSTAVAWSMAGMILACGIAHATAQHGAQMMRLAGFSLDLKAGGEVGFKI